MTAICQKTLADAPWMQAQTRRLPGVQPLDPRDWIVVDDAYAGQMSERARILKDHRADVLQTLPKAYNAIQELHDTVLAHLAERDDFEINGTTCLRPDGVRVDLYDDEPLAVLCRLVTEDFCILQKSGSEHDLTAALLCFPASWTLSQKFGSPLAHVHAPVEEYDDGVAKRVQRLFDAVQVGKPLWRSNALRYRDPELYQPRPENEPRSYEKPGDYIRTERQCILRLPETQAVVFSIQTRQVHIDNLTPEQRQGFEIHPVDAKVAQTR